MLNVIFVVIRSDWFSQGNHGDETESIAGFFLTEEEAIRNLPSTVSHQYYDSETKELLGGEGETYRIETLQKGSRWGT